MSAWPEKAKASRLLSTERLTGDPFVARSAGAVALKASAILSPSVVSEPLTATGPVSEPRVTVKSTCCAMKALPERSSRKRTSPSSMVTGAIAPVSSAGPPLSCEVPSSAMAQFGFPSPSMMRESCGRMRCSSLMSSTRLNSERTSTRIRSSSICTTWPSNIPGGLESRTSFSVTAKSGQKTSFGASPMVSVRPVSALTASRSWPAMKSCGMMKGSARTAPTSRIRKTPPNFNIRHMGVPPQPESVIVTEFADSAGERQRAAEGEGSALSIRHGRPRGGHDELGALRGGQYPSSVMPAKAGTP